MHPDAAAHILTDSERDAFDRDGYLHLRQVFTGTELAGIQAGFEAVRSAREDQVAPVTGLLSTTDFIRLDTRLADLIDHPRILPKVWGMLGWNIYLYHAHLDATPPSRQQELSDREYRAWHQDSRRLNDEIETHPRPRLSLKVAVVLTDIDTTANGSTWVVPGSQLTDEFQPGADGVDPDGAIPLLAKAGDLIFLDRRLWHSRSMNRSDLTRRVIFLGYSYRWLARKDDMDVTPLLPTADPIRRQILGHSGDSGSTYDPAPEHVPLRTWLTHHSLLPTARDHHPGKTVGTAPR